MNMSGGAGLIVLLCTKGWTCILVSRCGFSGSFLEETTDRAFLPEPSQQRTTTILYFAVSVMLLQSLLRRKYLI